MAKARHGFLAGVAFAALGFSCGTSQMEGGEDAREGGSEWTQLAPVTNGAVQETAVVVDGARFFVVAGIHSGRGTVGEVVSYDTESEQWTEHAPLPRALHHVNAAMVAGKLYVLGGYDPGFGAVGDGWAYDPEADSWSAVAPMPVGTERASCAVGAIDGMIYLAGGKALLPSSLVTSYDPTADAWTTGLAPLPTARHHGAGAVVDGLLYAIAGRGSGVASVTDRVDAYDPKRDRWTQRAPIPTARGGIGAGVVGGEIVVVGGEGNSDDRDGIFPQSEAYDIASDRWRSLEAMRVPRHGMGAAGIDSYLYVPGGATIQGFGATDEHDALRVLPVGS